MQELIVSLNSNILKLSTIDTEGNFFGFSQEIDPEVVEDSVIKDVAAFSKQLEALIAQNISTSKHKINLNFILEPQDVHLRFITISKTEDNFEEAVITQIKEKLQNVLLDSLYFSYRKIAPFLYQFVGVKKEYIENILEVSNLTGISLQSVLPWDLLLPKYTNTIEPSIFVAKRNGRQVISLSELSGVFFSGAYDEERSASELSEYVKELSFYKRSQPINKIYSLNYGSFDLEGFEVIDIEPPVLNDNEESQKEYAINLITNYLIDTDATILTSQVNLLNLLPLPVAKEKNTSLVVAGSVMGALLLAGAIFAGVSYFSGSESSPVQENNDVLSENTLVEEAVPNEVEEEPQEELQREDLKIRIENGSNINGIAGRTEEFLLEQGYEIVGIGNAEENSEPTILRFKPDFIGYSDLIASDLDANFPEIVLESDLEEDAEYDLLIIVGSTSNL